MLLELDQVGSRLRQILKDTENTADLLFSFSLMLLGVVVGLLRVQYSSNFIIGSNIILFATLSDSIYSIQTKWPKHESPTNCTPPTPLDTERDPVPAELPDAREVWDSSENTEST